jgi:hypothetical protein
MSDRSRSRSDMDDDGHSQSLSDGGRIIIIYMTGCDHINVVIR